MSQFDQKRKYKQIADAPVLLSLLFGLASGLDSMNSLSQGMPRKFSRSVLDDFLALDGLPRQLRKYLKSLIRKMRRGKMINLEHVRGKIVASVDGVETSRVRYLPEDFFKKVSSGLIGNHCQVAVHRNKNTGEIEAFEVYHRLVVICIITDRGPMPLAWEFQQSDAGLCFLNWLKAGKELDSMPCSQDDSVEKMKQEGELTTLKTLLDRLKNDYPNRAPFDVLIGDGLYDKSTILELVEEFGATLVAVHKDKRRSLYQMAEDDFSSQRPASEWSENKKSYEAWAKVYEDNNINRLDKKVKIVRIIRRLGCESVENYFYCSDRSFITPRFVEWCRHYRWKEENGFNAWTNNWNLLKHTFSNKRAVADAMIALIFISIILVENFRKGHLRRGKKKVEQSLRLFFRLISGGISRYSGPQFLKLLTIEFELTRA